MDNRSESLHIGTTAIPASYFVEDRSFDADLDCIDAVGQLAAEPEYENAPSASSFRSYRDVVVERSTYIRFLKVCYPTVLNPKSAQEQLGVQQAIRRLAEELSLSPAMKKAIAADIIGSTIRNRRFVNEIWPKARARAGLPPRGLPGRKDKSSQK